MLPSDYPPWQTVYHVFRKWNKENVWDALNNQLRALAREAHGKRSRPTAAILDSQSVKSDPHGGSVGYDAGKRIKGRKRHILVDTLGLLLGVHITPASNPALYATLGSLEFQFGQTEKAITHLRRAVQIEGDSADFLTRLALAEFTVGNTEEFKNNLDSALKQNSSYTPALKARAGFNLSITSYKKATTDYVDIVKIEPENVEALLALAVCFYKTGDKDATTMTYERVLSIEPDNTLVKDNLITVKNSM